jgi:hypothetical protein
VARGSIEEGLGGAAQDPATSAASMIADQALSIFQAVEAQASEIDARAHLDADEIRRSTLAVADPARAHLDAISRGLDAIATALERVATERAGADRDG